MKSLQFSDEKHREGYYICSACDTPTMLLTSGALVLYPDEEPYQCGQPISDIQDEKLKEYAEHVQDNGVELDEEITIHYCPACEKITSIAVNWK